MDKTIDKTMDKTIDKPMDKTKDFAGVTLDVALGREPAGKPKRDDPFRIAILGDFSGRSSRGIREPATIVAQRRPVRIGRDNFDEVLAQLKVQIELPVAGRISFAELDDFHPDRLYQRLAMFEALRNARRDGGTMEASSASPAPAARPGASEPSSPPKIAMGGLLESALESTEALEASKGRRAAGEPAGAKDSLRSWLDEQVAPHVIAPESSTAAQRRALVDQVIAAQMRALLHYPDMQALEALWRSVFFLARRTNTDDGVSLWLLDVTREELQDGGAFRALANHGRWAVIAGAYSFGPGESDIAALATAGAAAEALGAPFVGAAGPRAIGCESFSGLSEPSEWAEPEAAWESFRASAPARYVGLASPRFLLRLPYGAATDACEAIRFEEMGEEFDHGRLLWGNPAILCAHLLAASFDAEGWELRPGRHSNVDGLPLYLYRCDGETVALPCAETLMTERAAKAMLERGAMCFATLRDSDEVHLVRFQSLAKPSAPLPGPWN